VLTGVAPSRRPEKLKGSPGRSGRSHTPRSEWGTTVEEFLTWKRAESPVGEDWIRRMRWELLRVPLLLHRVGARASIRSARDLLAEDIGRIRMKLPWERATFMIHFSALRQFLRWAHNPIADRKTVWSLPSGEPTHRRWLTKEQVKQLYRRSTGAPRILVGLEALNGLRRIEVLRMRFKDILLEEECLLVRGKGSHGGKGRRIPVHRLVLRDLRRWARFHQPDDPVLPLSKSGADSVLGRAVRSAGFPAELKVSHHDLRRSFGRLAHEAGMDLVQLKNMLGHASVEMSVHYIGLDSDRMREGLERFSRYMR
jgi:integrase